LQLIIISGATCSGKTDLSIQIAQQENSVIISADSRQFYKELNIGTAKPTLNERKNIQHYFIDSHSIHDPINATRFACEASTLIETLFKKHKKIIITGGSGLFIDTLCYGIDSIPHDPIIQQQLNTELQKYGLRPLLNELQEKDPNYFQQVDKSNPRRIIRALEVIRSTNSKYSELRKGTYKKNKFELKHFIIDRPREELYQRINSRVDNMIEQGLEHEAHSLLPYRHLKPLQTVGYKEWFDFFDGTIDRKTCIEKIKQNTRHYAKRQITWFKKYKDATYINPVLSEVTLLY